ncbi:MAG: hypothetical protein C3F07_04860 [Anaerolineales bacterium]|nr:hypothetical protein [Anaerolineae bacterium]PWB75668.1 MAG: hypothetical protein C3F07_04860 [Anaerolineales bacterium]
MKIIDAQKEVRTVYLGAFSGLIVTSIIWFVSAALGTRVSKGLAVWALVLGGTFIFPLSQVFLKSMGRNATLSKENPFGTLAMLIAFTIPATYPLIAGAFIHNSNWFYPAFLVVIGAHYLPFIFLYGMWQFSILSVLLVALGTVFGMYFPEDFTLGGWVGGAVYLLFAFPFRAIALKK